MEININAGVIRRRTFFTHGSVDDRQREEVRQVVVLFTIMSGTYAILIIFYKVLLRKPLMSSSAEKLWCNYTKILLRPWLLISAAKTVSELAESVAARGGRIFFLGM